MSVTIVPGEKMSISFWIESLGCLSQQKKIHTEENLFTSLFVRYQFFGTKINVQTLDLIIRNSQGDSVACLLS